MMNVKDLFDLNKKVNETIEGDVFGHTKEFEAIKDELYKLKESSKAKDKEISELTKEIGIYRTKLKQDTGKENSEKILSEIEKDTLTIALRQKINDSEVRIRILTDDIKERVEYTKYLEKQINDVVSPYELSGDVKKLKNDKNLLAKQIDELLKKRDKTLNEIQKQIPTYIEVLSRHRKEDEQLCQDIEYKKKELAGLIKVKKKTDKILDNKPKKPILNFSFVKNIFKKKQEAPK